MQRIDILAVNGAEVVVVEVKTTLRPEGVTHSLGKLGRFLDWCPEYRGHTIYGAVAFLRTDPDIETLRRAPGSVRHPGHRQQRHHRERGGLRAACVLVTAIVDDRPCGAVEAAVRLRRRPGPEPVSEALVTSLADAEMDDTDNELIEQARAEAAEQGGVEFEAFFNRLDRNRS